MIKLKTALRYTGFSCNFKAIMKTKTALISDSWMFFYVCPLLAILVVHIGNENSFAQLISIPSYYSDLVLAICCSYLLGLYVKYLVFWMNKKSLVKYFSNWKICFHLPIRKTVFEKKNCFRYCFNVLYWLKRFLLRLMVKTKSFQKVIVFFFVRASCNVPGNY